jgi:hypothetical protein
LLLGTFRSDDLQELTRLPLLSELYVGTNGGLHADGDPIGTIASIRSLKSVRLDGLDAKDLNRLKQLRPDLKVQGQPPQAPWINLP